MLRILIAALLFLVSASLAEAAVCTVHVSDLDFGTVDAIGSTPAMSSADVSIDCISITPGATTITVCGNIGAGGGGDVGGVRQMSSTGGALGFALYAPGGDTQPWGSTLTPDLGDPVEIDVPVGGGDTTASLTTELNGLVPAGQTTAPVGSYRSDFAASDAVFTYAEGALDCAAPSGGTDTAASFAVLASIEANCLLQASDLDFGTAGIIGTNIDASTDLKVTCTSGTGYSIAIDGGTSHDPANRVLTSGGNTVRYGLYSDPPRSSLWGTAPADTVSGNGSGAEQTLDVYGRIPPQPAAPGAYTDRVVVTITYN